MEINSENKIAIIGFSGIFPDAPDLNQFYLNLCNGKDSVRDLDMERVKTSTLDTSKTYELMAHLDRVDVFDHAYFNISKREAGFMDPSHRLLLELSVTAIENAGYSLESLNGSSTGVFIGGKSISTYAKLITDTDPSVNIGNLNSMASGRISYHLNFQGPSMVIDTACSSSLVAVHMACNSILMQESEYALAGGFKVQTEFNEKGSKDILGINSEDGKTRAFDINSTGTGNGEGGGIILLKRLDKAIKDKDHIHAIIAATAINQDGGRSNGITAPSPHAQEAVIKMAWEKAGIHPNTISYIEAHGTGTKLGDPIEIQALSKAFKNYTNDKARCAISALKTNIGHLDNAAGIGGLIKAVLSLKHKELFQTVHFKTPNPLIDLTDSFVYINNTFKPWKTDSLPRRCGVSSFGLSGTNSHIILEEAPMIQETEINGNPILLKISAKTTSAFKNYLIKLKSHFTKKDIKAFEDSITINRGRSDYKYRYCIKASNTEELIREIGILQEEQFIPNEIKEKSAVLLLSGNELNIEIHNKLYENYPAYKRASDELKKWVKSSSKYCNAFLHQYALYYLLLETQVNIKMIISSGIGKLVNEVVNQQLSLDKLGGELENFSESSIDQTKFEKVVSSLIEEEIIFIDLGLSGTLLNAINNFKDQKSKIRIVSLVELTGGNLYINIDKLYNNGLSINWHSWYKDIVSYKTECPTYSFDQIRCWPKEIESTDVSEWMYEVHWEQSKIGTSNFNLKGNSFLIILDDIGLGENIASELELQRKKVIKVKRGNSFSKSEEFYIVDFSNEINIKSLKESCGAIDGIIHFSNYFNSNNFEGQSEVKSFMCFAKIFNENLSTPSFLWAIITANANKIMEDDKINPYHHAIHAFQKALLIEFPLLNMKTMDFDLKNNARNVSCILEELKNEDVLRFISYRNGIRYVPIIQKIKYDLEELKENVPIIKNGIYVVTGGATGIGLSICKKLATQGASHIIILGRTPLAEGSLKVDNNNIFDSEVLKRITALNDLRTLNVKIDYYPIDISDRDQMRNIFENIKHKINKFNGIVHCAVGSTEFIPLPQLNENSITDLLKAKIKGTVVLDEVTDIFKPDFFIMFSSLNAQVPQKYSTGYATANAFMDGYAYFKQSQRKNFISISWPGWNHVGRSALVGDTGPLKKINIEDGLIAFQYAISLKKPVLLIANVDLNMFLSNPFFKIVNYNGVNPLSLKLPKQGIAEDLPLNSINKVKDVVVAIWKEVLMANQINDNDDFFELGGHSLNGGQVINRINRILNIQLELNDLFENGTINELIIKIEKLIQNSHPLRDVIATVNKKDYYHLSNNQKRIWIMSQTDKGSLAYNLTFSYELKFDINFEFLKNAFFQLVERHEGLRTVFPMEKGKPMQKILSMDEASFKVNTINLVNEFDKDQKVLTIIKNQTEKVFDLEKGPLLAVILIKLEENRSILFCCIHHIICDGWSLSLIFKEIIALYESKLKNTVNPLSSLTLQYKDYAEWQHKRMLDGDFANDRLYWLQKLRSPLPILNMQTDFPRPALQTFDGDSINFKINALLSNRIKEIAKQNGVTPFILMLSVFKTLMYCLSQQEDILVGTDLAGRVTENTEKIIGMFVNVVVFRSNPLPDKKFINFLIEIKQIFLEAMQHQHYQFDEIVTEITKERDISRNPIFDVMFVMVDNNIEKESNSSNMLINKWDEKVVRSQFDMSFVITQIGTEIKFFVKYNSNLFRKSTIQKFIEQYNNLLNAILQNSELTLNKLKDIDSEFLRKTVVEKQQIVRTKNLESLKKLLDK